MRIDGRYPPRKAASTSRVRRYACGQCLGFPRNPYLEKLLHKVKDKFAELETLQLPEDVGMLAALALTSTLAAVRLRLAATSRRAAAIHADVTSARVTENLGSRALRLMVVGGRRSLG
jgi:hypothetical protein